MGYAVMDGGYGTSMGMDMAGGYAGGEQNHVDFKLVGSIGVGIALGIVLGIVLGRRNVKKKQL
ncbi:MAG: hypothetical protein J6M02_01705 [Clostridia bacterium]|nr:hypothetical protein [Clostridia bacterium]